jgi:hypothetical protein
MDFDNMVEAVRAGTVIARDKKAAMKWDARRASKTTTPLTGRNLGIQFDVLHAKFPDRVKVN